jgi:predicted DCC family thiol-disulfide oxidoreductase YuxK
MSTWAALTLPWAKGCGNRALWTFRRQCTIYRRMSMTEDLQIAPAQDAEAAGPAKPIVYFDGGCPLCTREIAFYRRRAGMEDAIVWQDVMSESERVTDDLDRDAALARFHVRRVDGVLLSGAEAFIHLWRLTPGFGWLGAILSVPPLPAIAELGYRGFLKIRPLMIPRKACPDDACATGHTPPNTPPNTP